MLRSGRALDEATEHEQKKVLVLLYACCVGDGAGQKCQARVQACALDDLRPMRVMSTRGMFPKLWQPNNQHKKKTREENYSKQVDEQNDIAKNIVCIFR